MNRPSRSTVIFLIMMFVLLLWVVHFVSLPPPKESSSPEVAPRGEFCETAADYFFEFKNPVIVANRTYYLYRIPYSDPFEISEVNFSGISSSILNDPVRRTEKDVPIYHPTLYFWWDNYGWSYKVCD